jgi:aconitase A
MFAAFRSALAASEGSLMAKPNYQFEKRQRDLAKKSKQEEKRRQKLAGKLAGDDSSRDAAANPPAITPANVSIAAVTLPSSKTTPEP